MRWHSGFCSKTNRLDSDQQGSHPPWPSERHPTQAQMGKGRCSAFFSLFSCLFIFYFRWFPDMEVGRGMFRRAGRLVTWGPLPLHLAQGIRLQCKRVDVRVWGRGSCFSWKRRRNGWVWKRWTLVRGFIGNVGVQHVSYYNVTQATLLLSGVCETWFSRTVIDHSDSLVGTDPWAAGSGDAGRVHLQKCHGKRQNNVKRCKSASKKQIWDTKVYRPG